MKMKILVVVLLMACTLHFTSAKAAAHISVASIFMQIQLPPPPPRPPHPPLPRIFRHHRHYHRHHRGHGRISIHLPPPPPHP